MHVTILTVGTRGDTQPYVALAQALQRVGHTVRIATSKTFELFVKRHGVEFAPIQADVFEMANNGQAHGILNSTNPLAYTINMLRTFGPLLDQMQEDAWNACQGTDAIIYHPGIPNGYYIARHLGVPCFLATLYPISLTRSQPHLMFYDGPRMGNTYNLLTHAITDQVVWQICRPSIQKFWRKTHNYSPAPFIGPYWQQRAERLTYLYGYSQHVFPRPYDWPDYLHITGYWFLEPPSSWQPPADLLRFLESGPPPVYVGFGSVGSRETAHETTRTVLHALKLSGQRGVLSPGWIGMGRDFDLPDDVFLLESIPHTWLFPRVAAVVHHGGAGTTAAGLRAGVPCVIVPHTGDQPIWGRRVAELGVAPPPIPRSQLSAVGLAAAIARTVNDRHMRARAALLGQRILAEDGITRAVEIFQETTQQPTMLKGA